MTQPLRRCARGVVLAVTAAAPLAAQSPANAALLAGEQEALAAKAAADYPAAADRFRELLAIAVARDGDAERAALAEYFALMAANLTTHAGTWAALDDALQAAAGAPLADRHPWLDDALRQLSVRVAIERGDVTEVTTRTAEAGFIDAFWLAGPFDNERGAGFSRQLPPEEDVDLEAQYEGKKRAVGWRPLPVPAPPGGHIDLDAMMRPNDQVLAYCATALMAEAERDALLHLGSDEAFAVFLNGERIGGRDVRRPFAPDQDVLVLPLVPGANLLLIKVCEQDGAFALAARLTQVDGQPLTDVRASDRREDLDAARRTTARAAHLERATTGAVSFFADRVDRGGDPRDAIRLAYLLGMRTPDDQTERRDATLAERAVEALPDDDNALYLRAFTRIRTAAISAELDDNLRRRDYERILARNPQHAQSLIALARLERASGLFRVAEDLLHRALAQRPDNTAALVELAATQEMRGHPEIAIQTLRKALQTEPVPPRARRALGHLLAAQGAPRPAIELLRADLSNSFALAAAEDLSTLLLRTGARDEAVALLRRSIALMPFAKGPRLRLARLLAAEGNAEAAFSTFLDWLRICPEDDQVLVEVSALHGRQGDRERQREALRAALELNPNDKTGRRYLEFLEADEKPFYHDYAIDGDAVLATDPGPPADAGDANDPYYYPLLQTVVHAYRNGTTSTYRHRIVRILTEEGGRRMAFHRVAHYRGEQRARLLDVRVLGADGSERRPRLRGTGVRLPPLSPGDTVEIRERVDDLGPTFFGDYFGLEHNLSASDGAPCRRSELTVVLERGREYRTQVRGGAPAAEAGQDAAGHTVQTWRMTDLPRAVLEERRPARSESDPLVRVTTYRDWQQFGAWWWDLIKRQLEVSPAMRALVAERTAGLSSAREKIDALYEFVTTDVRYTAWEFGVHGYKPYSTPVVFERRHGDCKDKALLLVALLSELDIPAFPVLIHADPLRSEDDLSLPLVRHFNHCIAYVPPFDDQPGRFLDGTATYHPADTLPEMDQGAAVLIVQPDGVALDKTAWVRAEDNADESNWGVSLQPSGAARVALQQRAVGNRAVPLRESLSNTPAKRTEQIERRLTAAVGTVDVLSVSSSDPHDLDDVVELTVEFDARELAARVAGRQTLSLPLGLETEELQGLVRAPERRFALLLGVPDAQRSVIHYALPPGFAPVEIPPPVELRAPFGSYVQRASLVDGELRVERTRTLDVNRIEPAEYPEFREFIQRIGRADERRILIEKRGGRP